MSLIIVLCYLSIKYLLKYKVIFFCIHIFFLYTFFIYIYLPLLFNSKTILVKLFSNNLTSLISFLSSLISLLCP